MYFAGNLVYLILPASVQFYVVEVRKDTILSVYVDLDDFCWNMTFTCEFNREFIHSRSYSVID